MRADQKEKSKGGRIRVNSMRSTAVDGRRLQFSYTQTSKWASLKCQMQFVYWEEKGQQEQPCKDPFSLFFLFLYLLSAAAVRYTGIKQAPTHTTNSYLQAHTAGWGVFFSPFSSFSLKSSYTKTLKSRTFPSRPFSNYGYKCSLLI